MKSLNLKQKVRFDDSTNLFRYTQKTVLEKYVVLKSNIMIKVEELEQ